MIQGFGFYGLALRTDLYDEQAVMTIITDMILYRSNRYSLNAVTNIIFKISIAMGYMCNNVLVKMIPTILTRDLTQRLSVMTRSIELVRRLR